MISMSSSSPLESPERQSTAASSSFSLDTSAPMTSDRAVAAPVRPRREKRRRVFTSSSSSSSTTTATTTTTTSTSIRCSRPDDSNDSIALPSSVEGWRLSSTAPTGTSTTSVTPSSLSSSSVVSHPANAVTSSSVTANVVYPTTSSSSSSSSGGTIDLHDPFQVVALAVRFDECRHDEALLTVPLESGRLYDSVQFARALEYLQVFASSSRSHERMSGSGGGGGTKNGKRPSTTSNSGTGSQTSSRRNSRRHPALAPSIMPSTASGGGGGGANTSTTRKKTTSIHAASSPPIAAADSSSPSLPSFALTPIILSGLLTAMQQQRQDAAELIQTNHTNIINNKKGLSTITAQPSPTMLPDCSAELVLASQTMRQAALLRVRRWKQRQQLQKIILPILTAVVLFGMYLRHVSNQRRRLVQGRYVSSCDASRNNNNNNNMNTGIGAYESACRLAEADLWERFHDIFDSIMMTDGSDPPFGNLLDSSCNSHGNRWAGNFDEAPPPLVMHTSLSQQLLTLDVIDHDRDSHRRAKKQQQQKLRGSTRNYNAEKYPYRWLGESIVNRLVREAIDSYLSAKLDLNVLDVGCGVGGTFYALLPENRTAFSSSLPATDSSHKTTKQLTRKFSYHGIAVSAAEIYHAQLFMDRYKLNDQIVNLTLEQRSFDDPGLSVGRSSSSRSYTAIVAIDSLSFSRNLRDTVVNLMKLLQSGGVFVVVDDVSLPSEAGRIAMDPTHRRPSLTTHDAWTEIFTELKCKVQLVRDLSLEYELDLAIVPPHLREGQHRHDGRRNNRLPSAFRLSDWWFSLSHAGGAFISFFDAFFASALMSSSSSARRLLKLDQDRTDLVRARQKRDEEHNRRASLAYHMYLCQKE